MVMIIPTASSPGKKWQYICAYGKCPLRGVVSGRRPKRGQAHHETSVSETVRTETDVAKAAPSTPQRRNSYASNEYMYWCLQLIAPGLGFDRRATGRRSARTEMPVNRSNLENEFLRGFDDNRAAGGRHGPSALSHQALQYL